MNTSTILRCILFFLCLSELVLGQFSPDVDTFGLWHFDEGSGTTTNDVSSSNNHGTITGATWTTDGKYDKALYFDGDGDYVTVGKPFPGIQNVFTIDLYFRGVNIQGGKEIFSNRAHYRDVNLVMGTSPTKVAFSFWSTDQDHYSIETTSTIVNDVWYHVRAVYDGQTMKLYLDDMVTPESTRSVVANVSWSENYMGTYIGGLQQASYYSFTGYIDEVRISNFDRSLPVELQSFNAIAGNGKVTLRWTSQSEMNNLGFHLLRAMEEKGDYQRITTALIPGAGNTSTSQNYSYIDWNVINNSTYWYKLEDIDFKDISAFHGPVHATPAEKVMPKNFCLHQNYPNPFNPETTIAYDLPEEGLVDLTVYNLNGDMITTIYYGIQEAGSYQYRWRAMDENGSRVPSGLYVLKLSSDNFIDIKKMMILK